MQIVKLGEVCKIIAGQSPPSDTYNKDGIGLPFFQGKTDFGQMSPSIRMYCSMPLKIAKPNDILLSVRAPVGPTNICNTESCIGRGLSAIRVGKKIDTTFLLYYFRYFENELASKGKGSTFGAITQDEIYNIKIPLRDLQIQKQIAQILEDADRARQQRKAANALTEQFLQSSFLHLFGDLVLNSKGWPSKRLDEVASISSGVTKGRNLNGAETITVPYMRVANVQDGFLNLSEIKTIEIKSYELEKYLLHEGDILLTEGGDPDKLGRGAVWQNQIENCIHQNHIFKVRADRKLFTPEFLSLQFGSDYGKRYFLKAAKQTTGIASINSTQLKAFPILIPPLPLQQHFASLIADAEILRQKQRQSERELEQLFQALLHQWFGQPYLIDKEIPLPLAAECDVPYSV